MDASQPQENRASAELRGLFESGRPLIYVRSPEERRVNDLLARLSRRAFDPPIPVWVWSQTQGLKRNDAGDAAAEPLSARQVLDWIATHKEKGIFQLRDFHEFMRDEPEVRRRLRDLYLELLDTGKFVVITSPVADVPVELDRSIAVVQLGMPDFAETMEFLRDEVAALTAGGAKVDSSEERMFEYARTLQGLTLDEGRYALRRAIAQVGALDERALPFLAEEKKLLIKKTGMIEFVSDPGDMNAVGGLEYLKRWLLERQKLFLMRESMSAEIVPKGLLIMGVSGCGKSLTVKAISTYFRLPLYRIDMVEVFSGRHGPPDGAFVEACRIAEALSPAVVWFDEIEMGISADSGDSAVVSRIFAFFLTWMQEKARGLFIAATANRVDLLPAEMIRKGRFDEVFFVDLPSEEERIEILKIHLARRGFDPANFDLERLKRFTRGWSGAECEQCVISAITAARLEDRELATSDLIAVASQVVPLSRTMKEQVDHIRSWAHERAVRASPREVQR
jgi:SpoVK/Ycf46/Vps4 family AAA+-type ATPase